MQKYNKARKYIYIRFSNIFYKQFLQDNFSWNVIQVCKRESVKMLLWLYLIQLFCCYDLVLMKLKWFLWLIRLLMFYNLSMWFIFPPIFERFWKDSWSLLRRSNRKLLLKLWKALFTKLNWILFEETYLSITPAPTTCFRQHDAMKITSGFLFHAMLKALSCIYYFYHLFSIIKRLKVWMM